MNTYVFKHTYQVLPPILWSECLSYLPPDELSISSDLLQLAIKSDGGNSIKTNVETAIDGIAEQAAWLAVRSMVEIAERHWKVTDNGTSEDFKSELDGRKENEEFIRDIQTGNVHKLVLEDATIVGDFLRYSCSNHTSTAISNLRRGICEGLAHSSVFRFRDETWQGLYGLLYSILMESSGLLYAYRVLSKSTGISIDEFIDNIEDEDIAIDLEEILTNICDGEYGDEVVYAGANDKQDVAFTIWLVFGAPTLPVTLMTLPLRRKLATIAHACKICCMGDCGDRFLSQGQPCFFSNARCYLMAIRLAKEGLWEHASDIVTFVCDSRFCTAHLGWIEERRTNVTSTICDDGSLLSIDGMIYRSTFLIDRLHTQTHTQKGDYSYDTQELATAIRLGREAVGIARRRYKVFKAKQIKAPRRIKDRINWSHLESETGKALQTTNLAPPPMDSLFANDALRFMHAKLALVKALNLLAQSIVNGAFDLQCLRYEGVLPMFDQYKMEAQAEDEDRMELRQFVPDPRERATWVDFLLKESHRHLEDGLAVVDEHAQCEGIGESFSRVAAVFPLCGALVCAKGELHYCAAIAATATVSGKQQTVSRHMMFSIRSFTEAFGCMVEGVLSATSQSRKKSSTEYRLCAEKTLEVILQCGKDIGRACDFASVVGVDCTDCLKNIEGSHLEPRMSMDFAHLVSIYRYGSFHPTTLSIQHLIEHQHNDDFAAVTKSLAQRYFDAASWLVANYGPKTNDIHRLVLENKRLPLEPKEFANAKQETK